MQIKFNCCFCHAKISAEDEFCGRRVSCPGCGEHLFVPEAQLGSGTMVAGYRIDQFLGAGAMGEVYLANQVSMNRKVALKVMSEDLASDERDRQRFERETKVLARLDHRNIVLAYEAGLADGRHFLAMEFIKGRALDERLTRESAIPEADALDICIKVAEALKYAWERFEMLHRDIKPANIMIDKSGDVKLMDMGIAKGKTDESNTMVGAILGTPYYMSPEQARGQDDLDFRSDLYAVGATLFHLVTGQATHTGDTSVQIMRRKLKNEAPPARSINSVVSAECEALLADMLSIDRDSRPESWDEAIARLTKVRDRGSGGAATGKKKKVLKNAPMKSGGARQAPAPKSDNSTMIAVILFVIGLIVVVVLLLAQR
jgi:serine/threonine-protein kinase